MEQPKTTHMDLNEFAAKGHELLKRLRNTDERVVLTVDGQPAVILLDVDFFEGMLRHDESRGSITNDGSRIAWSESEELIGERIRRSIEEADNGEVCSVDALLAELDREFPHLKP